MVSEVGGAVKISCPSRCPSHNLFHLNRIHLCEWLTVACSSSWKHVEVVTASRNGLVIVDKSSLHISSGQKRAKGLSALVTLELRILRSAAAADTDTLL